VTEHNSELETSVHIDRNPRLPSDLEALQDIRDSGHQFIMPLSCSAYARRFRGGRYGDSDSYSGELKAWFDTDHSACPENSPCRPVFDLLVKGLYAEARDAAYDAWRAHISEDYPDPVVSVNDANRVREAVELYIGEVIRVMASTPPTPEEERLSMVWDPGDESNPGENPDVWLPESMVKLCEIHSHRGEVWPNEKGLGGQVSFSVMGMWAATWKASGWEFSYLWGGRTLVTGIRLPAYAAPAEVADQMRRFIETSPVDEPVYTEGRLHDPHSLIAEDETEARYVIRRILDVVPPTPEFTSRGPVL
jgi:hypothetical protein